MDCIELRIVGNKESYDQEEIRYFAVHAFDLWQNAQFFEASIEGLKASISDCAVVGGATRRMGQKRKSWGMSPEQFVDISKNSGNSRFAVVFGNERTGLTDTELACCSLAINIPTSSNFPSLNLSHAVQIICYTLFRKYDQKQRGYELLSINELDELISKISTHLDTIGIYTHPGREKNKEFLTDIFARSCLSASEAQRLETLFRKIAYIKTESSQK